MWNNNQPPSDPNSFPTPGGGFPTPQDYNPGYPPYGAPGYGPPPDTPGYGPPGGNTPFPGPPFSASYHPGPAPPLGPPSQGAGDGERGLGTVVGHIPGVSYLRDKVQKRFELHLHFGGGGSAAQNQQGGYQQGAPHPQPPGAYPQPHGAYPQPMGYPPPAGVPHPQHTVVLEPPPTGVPHPAPTELQTYGGHFSYQYSKCNGRHKALLVGINYFGQNGELKESINRARDVRAFILRECGYNEVNIVQLYDNSTDLKVKPTKANIMANIKELVAGAQPNDSLFFFYAGHGGQTRDTNGDEDTGYDEVIYPGDHETSGPILDDELWEALVKPLPSGCRLTALFDSPHTESPLDLPFIYTAEGKIKEPNLTRQNRTSSADVICFSGPKLLQPGSDTLVAGGQSGTLSYELAVALSRKWGKTNQQLLVGLRESLKGQYSEVQLSSSHPLDNSIVFNI